MQFQEEKEENIIMCSPGLQDYKCLLWFLQAVNGQLFFLVILEWYVGDRKELDFILSS